MSSNPVAPGGWVGRCPAFSFCLLILAILPAPVRGAGPVITELMAWNRGSVLDEDGEATDWIEIHNPDRTSLSLEGWYLTDDGSDPRKWRFPAVAIPPGGFLLVFASEKDRADPASELHTNFKLDAQGEYLALVKPDGTAAFAFTPAFPAQVADDSYGLEERTTNVSLVAAGAQAAALVPTSNSLGTTWTGTTFNDAGWIRGPTGIGYDTGTDYGSLIGKDIEAAMRTIRSSAYIRVPFSCPDPSVYDALLLRVKYDDGFVAYLNGQEIARRNAPATLSYTSAATAEHGQPLSGSMSQDFDGAGTGYQLGTYGTAVPPEVRSGGPRGNYLHLMEDYTGSLTNTVGFDRTAGPAEVVTADFDFRMAAEAGYTGGERADGFGFALLDTKVYGTSGPGPSPAGVVWERPGIPSAFAVGFDIYDGSKTENTVSLNWRGSQIAAKKVTAFDLNGGVFHHARIEVKLDGDGSLVSVTLTPDSLGSPGAPVAVFEDVKIPGLLPFDCRVAFGGRTGGEFTSLDLDNIQVLFTPLFPTIQYEEIDVSKALAQLKAGSNVLAFHGLNISSGDRDFLILPELLGVTIETFSDSKLYFTEPTPGAPNGAGFPGVAAAPVFSKKGGAYTAGFSLSLTGGSPQASIRYTLDRTEPTETSPLYTAPISISDSVMVLARAYEPGLAPSAIITQGYLLLHTTVQTVTSNLPLMVVHTFGQGIGDYDYTSAQAEVVDLSGGRSSIKGVPSWSGFAGIKWRGSSSLGFPKKNFAFEVRDERREDLEVSILGFPQESDWILYGPYTDKTLMRDVLSYYWSNEIGRYAVRSRFIELYLNTAGGRITSADYQGVYAFMEKIKRDPYRVNIQELHPTDLKEPEITGGYILKKDRLDPGDVGFSTNRGQVFGYVDPKEREIVAAQKAWIKNYMDSFETALYGVGFRDPVNGYVKYIDVDSFIDHHILVELTKNIDGFRLSTFLYKDRGGKLFMGPIWDYNLTLGNANYLEGWIPEGWYYTQLSDYDYPWYRRLFQDPDFAQRYADRWAAHRQAQFRTDFLIADIDATATLLRESQARNFVKWPILGQYVWPNWYIGQTFQQEVDWMKGWLQDRLVWYDSNYLEAPRFNQDGGKIAPGFKVAMTAPTGTIYYTLDGSDPRNRGGSIRSGAVAYSAPVALSANVRVTARARVATEGRWSPPSEAVFVVETPRLAVTEIMYHPEPPPSGSAYIDEDFEFIEVQNIGTGRTNLVGVRLTGGIAFDFSTGAVPSLDSGAFIVVVSNAAAFKSRYGSTGIAVAGEYEGKLSNGGDAIGLEGPLGDTILDLAYDDAWYLETDGSGLSLVAVDPSGPPASWISKSGWRPSSVKGGTPGKADPGGLQLPGDGNQDGRLDISDCIFLLGQLFGGSAASLPCEGGGISEGGNLALLNVNGDAGVDISDSIFLLNFLFTGGSPPVLGTSCAPIAGCPNRCSL